MSIGLAFTNATNPRDMYHHYQFVISLWRRVCLPLNNEKLVNLTAFNGTLIVTIKPHFLDAQNRVISLILSVGQ